ncbi:high frequency lysogenization protein HflD [Marinobacteraceae bacterium S3BR75-40.1]
MSYSIEEQTVALAGVFQAATLVHQIAHTGTCPASAMEATVHSLFVTDPGNTLDVFGDLYGVKLGLKNMAQVLAKQSGQKDVEILRYGLNLIHLESRLKNRPDMLDVLSSRIDQARRGVDHFGTLHPNVLSNLASIYLDTISTFRLRIQVTGDPAYLRVDENAVKIRALLLSGIRAAVLWRQVGGRRWHLIFRRKRVIQTAENLAHGLD